MKKIISFLVCVLIILSSFGFVANAADYEFYYLSEMESIQPSYQNIFEIFKSNNPYGTGISVNQDILGKDGIDYIIGVFSPENLIPMNIELTKLIDSQDEEFPKNYMSVDFEDINRTIWTFDFNEERVLVTKNDGYSKAPKLALSQGLFTFKDKSLYDELIAQISEWDAEQENNNDEEVKALQTNKINFTDFKFIYIGLYRDSQTEIEWGVCEYLREGETEPVTMLFDSYFWTNDVKILKIKDRLADENTYVSENKRLIRLEGDNPTSGIEYDFYFDGYLISEVRLKLTVNEDMKVESAVHTITKTNGDIYGPYDFDMDKYNETGCLPSGLFSAVKSEIITDVTSDDENAEIKSEQTTQEDIKLEGNQGETAKNGDNEENTEARIEETKSEEILKEETVTEEPAPIDDVLSENETEKESVEDFIDVPPTHWAYNEINDFAKNGIVLGYGNGYFGVDDHITYEHFALLLDRLFGYKEDDTQSVPAIREDVIVSVVKALNLDVSDADVSVINEKFTDCETLREKNLKYIAKAVDIGLVIGSYGKLYPADYLTRAETVMLLSRALNY